MHPIIVWCTAITHSELYVVVTIRPTLLCNTVYIIIEYEQLDKQLDQLDTVLTSLEKRNDNLHEQALLFLEEARKMRENPQTEQTEQERNEKDCDSTESSTESDKSTTDNDPKDQ